MTGLSPAALFVRGLRHQGGRDVPPTPTNADRLRAFRVAFTPPVQGNSHPWPHLKKERRRGL